MFIDTAKIVVCAGYGGDGCVSFHREKYVAAGGPDGGDGGRGGDVIFVTDGNMSTLSDFRYKKKYSAGNGENGKPNRCYGKKGADLVIKVPRGTLVKEFESGRILADMSGSEKWTAAHGGHGGWGNCHFATSTRQVPRFAKAGIPGEKATVQLELKLLADVGLIGFPNVGKSTLLSIVSQAKPNIANYHFTTLTPVLGVVAGKADKPFVMADLPGLIEGASDGAGLGHEFLRHIDRCRLLLHVVDVSGSEGRDPIKDFDIINGELRKYGNDLSSRPQIVAGSKTDIADAENIKRLREHVTAQGYEFHTFSGATTEGVDGLINAVIKKLSTLPPVKIYEPETVKIEDSAAHAKKASVVKNGNVFTVEAPFLLGVINSVNFDDSELLRYFQRTLRKTGIIKLLEKAGINEGDTVKIFDLEFLYVK